MKGKEVYKKCDRCCFDIKDDLGDVMEHICIDNEWYLPPTKENKE